VPGENRGTSVVARHKRRIALIGRQHLPRVRVAPVTERMKYTPLGTVAAARCSRPRDALHSGRTGTVGERVRGH
jgi:hypothetical protein